MRSLLVWLVNVLASLADEAITRWPNETSTED